MEHFKLLIKSINKFIVSLEEYCNTISFNISKILMNNDDIFTWYI